MILLRFDELAHDFRDKTVTRTMVNAFSTDDAEEQSGTKPNFIGRVVDSEPESDEYPMNENYKDEGEIYFEHVYEIDVLSEDWGNLHEFSVKVNNNIYSKWMVLIWHLQDIHGDLEGEHGVQSLDDLAEFLTGRVYEFREIDWTEDDELYFDGLDKSVRIRDIFSGSDNTPNPMLTPVREVTDEDELGEIETSDAPEIDEDIEL